MGFFKTKYADAMLRALRGLVGQYSKKYDLIPDEIFEYFNVPVLDDAVKSGKKIRFSHKPDLLDYEGSYLEQEWNYLKNKHGFKSLKIKGDVWIGK